MAARIRTKSQRARDLVKIAEMYLRGMSQAEIATAIGLSRSQVGYDLQDVRKQWAEQTTMKLDEHKAEELARLDHLEAQHWQAWEDSRKESKTTTAANGTRGRTASVRTETRYGDPRFLQGISECIAERCKILGLYAPSKLVGSFTHDHEYTDEQVEQIAEQVVSKRKSGTRKGKSDEHSNPSSTEKSK